MLWAGPGRERAAGARCFLHSRAAELGAQRPGLVARLRDLPTVLRLAAVVLVGRGAARPQSTRATDDLEVEGIDIVIALDLSGSMQETDLVPNRLDAAKAVIQDFVRRRPTDRIGLVVFGREAYTLRAADARPRGVAAHGRRAAPRDRRRERTAIGNGIAVALNRLCGEAAKMKEEARQRASGGGRGSRAAQASDGDERSKVLIVLTDGEDNAGKLSPEDAARLRADAEGEGLHDPRRQQRRRGAAGRARRPPAPVNPKLLEEIASMTGGTPYLATDTRALRGSLPEDPRRSAKRRRSTIAACSTPSSTAASCWAAFALLAAEIALRLTRFSRIPWSPCASSTRTRSGCCWPSRRR